MFRRTLPILMVLNLAPVPGHAALHLMFPYDYLSLTNAERRHYLIGVLDARLAPFRATSRLDALTRCLTQNGVTRIQDVLEKKVIPSPETATIPMPYLVERALTTVCGHLGSPSK